MAHVQGRFFPLRYCPKCQCVWNPHKLIQKCSFLGISQPVSIQLNVYFHYAKYIYPYPDSVLNCGQLTKLIYNIKNTQCCLDWNLIGERGKSPYCLGVSCKCLAIAFELHCWPTLLEGATLWSLWLGALVS